MEEPRRGSVSRDQRGDDDHHHRRRYHRDPEPRRAHYSTFEKREGRGHDRERDIRATRRAEDEQDSVAGAGRSSYHERLGKRKYRSSSSSRDRSRSASRTSRQGKGRSREEVGGARVDQRCNRSTSPASSSGVGAAGSKTLHGSKSQRRPLAESGTLTGSSQRNEKRSEIHTDTRSTSSYRGSFREQRGEKDFYENAGHVSERRTRHRKSPLQRRSPELEERSRRRQVHQPRWSEAELDAHYRRNNEEHWRHREDFTHRRQTLSHEHRGRAVSPYGWSDDKKYPAEDEYDHDRRHRDSQRADARNCSSSSRHSRHRTSMDGTRPIQSVMDNQLEPRGQRIPSFESSHPGRGRGRGRGGFDTTRGRGGFDANRGRGGHHQAHGPPPPSIDTRHQYPSNSHYNTPSGSYHGSPHAASPYSQHGGWQTPQHYYNAPPAHAYAASPQSRHGSYPAQQPASYYPSQAHQYSPQQAQTPTYPSPAYRGGHASARGGGYPAQDRRFGGTSIASSPPQPPSQPSARGRGHFQNLRWTAGGGTQGGKPPDNGRSSGPASREQSVLSSAPPPPPPAPKDPAPPPPEEDNPFRPSKAFRVEDDSEKPQPSAEATKEPEPQAQKEPKFSFAFKGKATPATSTKPVTDLTQKMKEPPTAPRRDIVQDAARKPNAFHRDVPQAPQKAAFDKRPDSSKDPRDRYADQRRERELEAERYKQERQALAQRAPQDRKPPREPERDRAKGKPQVMKVTEKRKRAKIRPQLTAELRSSKSVYYRKQGNESVVGSGTYGKVYKGLHVYTGALVALKKIRMEGEKDGFPVTAVREIKLLQSLRHENVVRLQEVMVESNDCYMVFEYLSHDLTGLLNHPTFKLDHAHKKDLAKQLFQSLDYLHRRSVLHRDLKAANILVSSNGQLKLADFGLARFYSKHHTLDYTNRVITIWYRPPELLLGETQYGPAVDIWSAACVLVEIFTKHAIFPGDGGEINQLEKIYNMLGTPTRTDWPGLADMAWFELLRPAERRRNIFKERYVDRVSPEAFELLVAMLQYDPAKRPSAEEVLQHPYFTIEEPAPKQVTELANVDGDWHEFESKALRKENERRARKAAEAEKEKAKRRASSHAAGESRDAKRLKSENTSDNIDVSGKESPDNGGPIEIEPNMQPT